MPCRGKPLWLPFAVMPCRGKPLWLPFAIDNISTTAQGIERIDEGEYYSLWHSVVLCVLCVEKKFIKTPKHQSVQSPDPLYLF